MTQPRHLRLLVLLPLVVALLVVAVVVWQRDKEYGDTSTTPEISPLSTPAAATAVSSSPSQFSVAAALFWVVLGSLLALGVVSILLRWYKSTQ
jgi:uncharacterized membrane protein